MPAEVATALRERAGEMGCTVGETVARLLGVGAVRPAAPPPSSQATAYGGPRCRCKQPTMSKIVTNVCTTCHLIRRP